MQSAKPWHRYNPMVALEILLRYTTGRGSLRQRKMRAVLVIVADIIAHKALQMPFIENDYMVEQVAAAVADPTLGDTVLPRASEAGLAGGPGPISNK
jgi:hypothetical protein